MSLMKKTLAFSCIFFLSLCFISFLTYNIAKNRIGRQNVSQQIQREITVARLKLESSVNQDLALALQMARSPVIVDFFRDARNPVLERAAFAEMAAYGRAFSSGINFWVNDTDLKFYYQDKYSYTVDPDSPDEYWYNMTLYETETYNFNINYNPNLNSTSLWVNAPVFDGDGRPVGVVGTGIILDAFLEQTYQSISGSGEGALFFFNGSGEITGAEDKELVARKTQVAELLDGLYEQIEPELESYKDGNAYAFSLGDNEYGLCYVNALDWYLIRMIDISSAAGGDNSLFLMFLAVVVSIASICALYTLFISLILKPLSRLRTSMNNISGGDFTEKFNYAKNDEIGSLSASLSLITATVTSLIDGIRTKAAFVHDTNNMQQEKLKFGRGKSSVIHSEVDEINGTVSEQKNVIRQAADVVAKTTNSLQNFGGIIKKQGKDIEESGEIIQMLLNDVESIDKTRISAVKNMERLSASSELGNTHIKQVAEAVSDISGATQKLLETNKIISSISNQTNLLAMNAAIEAAHAGKAGDGFAVVAQEIRSLSEKTHSQSQNVAQVINGIIGSVEKVVEFSSITSQIFSDIVSHVSRVDADFKEMSGIIENENKLNISVAEKLKVLSSVSESVSNDFALMEKDTSEIVSAMDKVVRGIQTLASGVESITESASVIDVSFREVAELANKSEEQLQTLVTSLDKYTIL